MTPALRPALALVLALALAFAAASCKAPPRLEPRVILTDPEGAFILDVLGVRGEVYESDE